MESAQTKCLLQKLGESWFGSLNILERAGLTSVEARGIFLSQVAPLPNPRTPRRKKKILKSQRMVGRVALLKRAPPPCLRYDPQARDQIHATAVTMPDPFL